MEPFDVAERFLLKFVYVTSPEDVAGLRVYAYEIADESPPILLQEAKYRAPFVSRGSQGRSELTGEQLVYAHSLGRELLYSCVWVEP